MNMFLSCCCGAPSGNVRCFTDVVAPGWTFYGYNGWMNRIAAWCYVWQADGSDLTPPVTLTTEINTTTIYNDLGLHFSRGRLSNTTYHTLHPDHFLRPQAITAISIQPGGRTFTTFSSFTAAKTPKTYQVFVDGEDVSGLVTVPDTAFPIVNSDTTFPLSFDLPRSAYVRRKIDVVIQWDAAELAPEYYYWIPIGSFDVFAGTPSIHVAYELRRDNKPIPVQWTDTETRQGEIDAITGQRDRQLAFGEVRQEINSYFPSGSDAIPITAPWYPSLGPLGPVYGQTGNTPTVGLWQGEPMTFFDAYDNVTANYQHLKPGTGPDLLVSPRDV